MKFLRLRLAAMAALALIAAGGMAPQIADAVPIQSIPYAQMAPGGGGLQYTITSGCATATIVHGGATSGTFTSTATTCTPVIHLGLTAPNGWICFAQDITSGHSVVFTQTATTTTSCTVTGTITSGDTVQFVAFWY